MNDELSELFDRIQRPYPPMGSPEERERLNEAIKAEDELNEIIRKLDLTYEVSSQEPLHPDPSVVSRMVEVAISHCKFGCKIYADPKSSVRVLAHNSAYGCKK